MTLATSTISSVSSLSTSFTERGTTMFAVSVKEIPTVDRSMLPATSRISSVSSAPPTSQPRSPSSRQGSDSSYLASPRRTRLALMLATRSSTTKISLLKTSRVSKISSVSSPSSMMTRPSTWTVATSRSRMSRRESEIPPDASHTSSTSSPHLMTALAARTRALLRRATLMSLSEIFPTSIVSSRSSPSCTKRAPAVSALATVSRLMLMIMSSSSPSTSTISSSSSEPRSSRRSSGSRHSYSGFPMVICSSLCALAAKPRKTEKTLEEASEMSMISSTSSPSTMLRRPVALTFPLCRIVMSTVESLTPFPQSKVSSRSSPHAMRTSPPEEREATLVRAMTKVESSVSSMSTISSTNSLSVMVTAPVTAAFPTLVREMVTLDLSTSRSTSKVSSSNSEPRSSGFSVYVPLGFPLMVQPESPGRPMMRSSPPSSVALSVRVMVNVHCSTSRTSTISSRNSEPYSSTRPVATTLPTLAWVIVTRISFTYSSTSMVSSSSSLSSSLKRPVFTLQLSDTSMKKLVPGRVGFSKATPRSCRNFSESSSERTWLS
mmetsp:Transcript_9318/g.26147  ORF Transcript_9318/g.26147 Transcript_9318/m.26147 type:complete len:548 (-) Transcript_9318:1266-2909(-)